MMGNEIREFGEVNKGVFYPFDTKSLILML